QMTDPAVPHGLVGAAGRLTGGNGHQVRGHDVADRERHLSEPPAYPIVRTAFGLLAAALGLWRRPSAFGPPSPNRWTAFGQWRGGGGGGGHQFFSGPVGNRRRGRSPPYAHPPPRRGARPRA